MEAYAVKRHINVFKERLASFRRDDVWIVRVFILIEPAFAELFDPIAL